MLCPWFVWKRNQCWSGRLSFVKEFVGNTMEFGAFRLAQVKVAAFPPRWCTPGCAFRGLEIFNNFNTHMELLCKSWVLNNLIPNHLCTSSMHAST